MARETAAASADAAHLSGTPAGRACKCVPACWCHPACTLTTRVAAEDHASTEHAWGTLGDLLPTLPPSDEGIELLSRRLSRPLTIYKALLQLRLVPTSAPLHIHLLGADGREGRGAVATTEAFAPLRTLLRGQCPELRLLLCGPNCAEDDFSSMEVAWGQPALPPGTPPMSVEYSTALYHEFAAVFGGARRSEAPQLAVAFNAGVWGYDTWRDTVRLLHAAGGARRAGWGAGGGRGVPQCVRCAGPLTHASPTLPGAPLLITSYNADEAEADEEELGASGSPHPSPLPLTLALALALALALILPLTPSRYHGRGVGVAAP